MLEPGVPSPVSDFRGEGFRLVEKAVGTVFPGVRTAPYVMNGASDSRFFGEISDCCLRFVPLPADDEQLAGIHGTNENVEVAALAPAVDFFKYFLREA